MKSKFFLMFVALFAANLASGHNCTCICNIASGASVGQIDPPIGNVTEMIAEGVTEGLRRAGPYLAELLGNSSVAKAAVALSEYIVGGKYITSITESDTSKAMVAISDYIVADAYVLPLAGCFVAGCLATVVVMGAAQHCAKFVAQKPPPAITRMASLGSRINSGGSHDTRLLIPPGDDR